MGVGLFNFLIVSLETADAWEIFRISSGEYCKSKYPSEAEDGNGLSICSAASNRETEARWRQSARSWKVNLMCLESRDKQTDCF